MYSPDDHTCLYSPDDHVSLYSPNDAFVVRNICIYRFYRYIQSVYLQNVTNHLCLHRVKYKNLVTESIKARSCVNTHTAHDLIEYDVF